MPVFFSKLIKILSGTDVIKHLRQKPATGVAGNQPIADDPGAASVALQTA